MRRPGGQGRWRAGGNDLPCRRGRHGPGAAHPAPAACDPTARPAPAATARVRRTVPAPARRRPLPRAPAAGRSRPGPACPPPLATGPESRRPCLTPAGPVTMAAPQSLCRRAGHGARAAGLTPRTSRHAPMRRACTAKAFFGATAGISGHRGRAGVATPLIVPPGPLRHADAGLRHETGRRGVDDCGAAAMLAGAGHAHMRPPQPLLQPCLRARRSARAFLRPKGSRGRGRGVCYWSSQWRALNPRPFAYKANALAGLSYIGVQGVAPWAV